MILHGKILGTTTVGERGQVVIPAEARDEIEIIPGEKLVVFGNKKRGMVILIKASIFNKVAGLFMSKSKEFEEMTETTLDDGHDQDSP